MGLLFFVGIIILLGVLWSLPLYFCVNILLWLFHVPYHLTLLQSLGLCWLANILHELVFKNKEAK